MASPQGKNLPAAAGEEVQLKVYRRCITRHLRVLDAKIANLEIQSTGELSKKSNGSSSSGLQEGIVTNTMSKGSSCSELLDEMERTRARREGIYAEFLSNQLKMQGNDDKGEGNGSGGAPPATASGSISMDEAHLNLAVLGAKLIE